MFTCPEKDIHSIYLDNELPAQYVGEYEAHLQTCEKCRAQLEKLKQLRSLLSADAQSLSLDKHVLDQSFDRLQSRLKYSSITRYSENPRKIVPFTIVKWTIPAVAAAAIFALVVPLRLHNKVPMAQQNNNVIAISRQQPTPITESNVIVNGNLPHRALTSLFDQSSTPDTMDSSLTAQFANFPSNQNTYRQNNTIGAALTGIDVFRPEFKDEDVLPLRIEIPHMTGIPLIIDTPQSATSIQK